MPESESHAIAIIGGATAGAEAAAIFSSQGILTVVFEQNATPYGKVEDGLPKWHLELRNKEYGLIDAKLSQDHVHFVPLTGIGRDIELKSLAEEWGFQAIVLANGAWRDRLLPLEGADAYIDRGLIYQNPYIQWFNHCDEPNYDGPEYEIVDDTLVIGGGLASIDMVKIVQLGLTLRGLRERGIEEDLVNLEVKGIPATLEKHGLQWEDLGYKGATLYYRRGIEDMPLVSMPDNANDKVREKIQKSRLRVLEKAQSKYLFKVAPLHAPVGLITEDERLVGIRFARTRLEEGRVILTDEEVEARAALVISSIGSIPAAVSGIPMRGELYDFQDWDLGRLEGFDTLFSAGNVVTGKGNIVDSRRHAKKVASHVADQYLQLADVVKRKDPLKPEARNAILKRVAEQQARVNYDGDYRTWIGAARSSTDA